MKKKLEIRTENLEDGMPTVDVARRNLINIIENEKKAGTRVLKIIHGYGSSGKGGVLRTELRKSLGRRKNEKKIINFIPGEEFGMNEFTLQYRDYFPAMVYDSDYNMTNSGITIIILQ